MDATDSPTDPPVDAESAPPDSAAAGSTGQAATASLEVGATVRLAGMKTARFNHHLAVVLPTAASGDARTAVRLITDDHAASETADSDEDPPKPMSVRTECLRLARPVGQKRLLQYGCANERVILRALQQWGLPPECGAAVVAHLETNPLRMSHVTAVACSSQSKNEGRPGYTFSMEASIQPGDADCWISGQRVALYDDAEYAELIEEDPDAPQFDEWLVYNLMAAEPPAAAEPEPAAALTAADIPEAPAPPSCGDGKVQIHRVSFRIPVLPHGPLSVRRFYLQAGNTPAAAARAARGSPRTWSKQDLADPDLLPATDSTGEGGWGVPPAFILTHMTAGAESSIASLVSCLRGAH
jgi:hypothetical protein